MSTPNNRNNKNGNRKDNSEKPKFNSILPIAVLAIMFVLLFNVLITTYQKSKLIEVHYNEFKQMLDEDQIAEAEIQSDRILLTTKEEAEKSDDQRVYYYTGLLSDDELLPLLDEHGVEYYRQVVDEVSPIIQILLTYVLPFVLIYFLFTFLMRNVGSKMGGGMSIGQSKAKVYMEKETGVTFADVAGQDEAKESLQEIIDFLYRGAETCARYKMMVDYHGICKPTGLQRTYPNVINYEGVHGLENMKWAEKTYDMPLYDVTIPFVRMVAGPMDYTQGAMRNAIRKNYAPIYTEPMSQGTRCHQLATDVIFESPLNMLCDNPSNYNREPECTEFIANIPTVWEKTVALDGKVGEYVAIARLHGDNWYIGALTNWDAREVELDLSFLGDGNYKLELFKDGINADRAACDYKKEVIPVPTDRKVKVKMAPGGGWAAKIYK